MLKELEKMQKKEGYKGVTTDDMLNLVGEEDIEKEKVKKEHTKEKKKDFKRDLTHLINKANFIIEVVDARDPLSYRSKELEHNALAKKDKKIILVLNKVDLVSKKNADQYATLLRKDYPTILFSNKNMDVFNNSIKELINLMKTMTSQIPNSNPNSNKMFAAIVGYPNVGKTTLVENIKKKFSHSVESLIIDDAEEITLDHNLIMFDFCGVILSKSESGPLMPKCSKNVEDLKNPIELIKKVVEYCKKEDLLELFEIADYENENEFLENVAKRHKFMMKKGYLDVDRAARFVIQAVIEGRIKYETNLE